MVNDDERMDDGEAPARLPQELLDAVSRLKLSLKDHNLDSTEFAKDLELLEQCVQYIDKTLNDGSPNTFSLADAAYALQNSSCIWSKMVDNCARECQRVVDLARGADSRGKDGDGDDGPEKKKRAPRTHVHPLSLPTDDRKENNPHFLERNDRTVRRDHKFVIQQNSQLPDDHYLAEAQPASLGIMECEKIASYVDDRNNKGADWAEFRINTMKLTKEGYYLIEKLHPGFYHVAEIFQRRGIVTPDRDEPLNFNFPLSNPRLEGPVGPVNVTGNVDPIDIGSDIGSQRSHHAPDNPEVPQVNDSVRRSARISRGAPRRAPLEPEVPFQRAAAIGGLRAQLAMDDMEYPLDLGNEAVPFRKRTRRILRKVVPKQRNVETVYFENFWKIPDTVDGVSCQFPRVLKKFIERWHVNPPPKVPAKRKRRENSVPNSGDSNASEVSRCPFDEPIVAPIDFDDQQNAQYQETEEPIVPDVDLFDPPDADPAEGELLRKIMLEGELHRNRNNRVYDDYVDDDMSDSSRIGQIDLCEWEDRLGKFLTVHEPNTLSFNLDQVEREMVVESHHNNKHAHQPLSSMVSRRTTGEVCRSFLSVLDLVNKSQVEVGRESDEDRAFLSSQGVNQVTVRVVIQTSEIGRLVSRPPDKGLQTQMEVVESRESSLMVDEVDPYA